MRRTPDANPFFSGLWALNFAIVCYFHHFLRVTKEVDANSKEAKAELKKKDEEEEKPKAACGPSILGKRSGGGLGSVLGKIEKKPKMGTLVSLVNEPC